MTAATYTVILCLLVESCLPEVLNRIWERSNSYDVDSTLKSRLENLMIFLKKKKLIRVSLTASGFDMHISAKKRDDPPSNSILQTPSGLVNYKWSLSDRKKKTIEQGCCYLRLNFGPIVKKYRFNSICAICNGRHVDIICSKDNEIHTKAVPGSR